MALPLRRGPRAAELSRALTAAANALPRAQLPRLDVTLTRSRRYSGGYDHTGRIELSRHAEHLGLAFLHELGHAVDHLLLGEGRRFGSETSRLAPWWRSVAASRAFAQLAAADDAWYWRSRREAFARSFAQWVAARSDDAFLNAELERRARGAGRQWSSDDFAPIRRALDAVFA